MLTQLERYKKTIDYIHLNFKEKVDIDRIEKVSYYSYRNINRIFLSLHQETIGKYTKRIRLEKAAEYIKYSDTQLYDIALEVGFNDLAAFSKAFKKKFGCSPNAFRQSTQQLNKLKHQSLQENKELIEYEIETLPSFKMLFLEHRGSYENLAAIEKTWETLLEYCEQNHLLSDRTVYFSESLDDNEISDDIHCRINVAITLDKENFEPEGLFQIKNHAPQKYAKFQHIGPSNTLEDTYNLIYASWLTDIQLEFVDKPTLEFYVNHEPSIPPTQFLTEIYIPIL
ncbi:MAG: GyrI-like domain-containing protein [Chitinophagales bacterium]